MAKKKSDEAPASPVPFAANLVRMKPELLAAAVHAKLGPKVQTEISVDEVRAVLAGLRMEDTRPSRPVPHLMIRRLRFKGEKKLSGQEPAPIDYDQTFEPGVNVILIESNLVGKSSIMKTIQFALTGDNDDYDKDVKAWIKEIWLEFSLGARDFTVLLAQRDDDWHCVLATKKEARPFEEVVTALSRKDQLWVGLTAIQKSLGEFFFSEYSLSSLGWTQARAGGKIVECSASWQTYFQAMRIKDDDHKCLMCEPVAGVVNQEPLLFMTFLGLNLIQPLNQLGVAQSTLKKSKQFSEEEIGKLKSDLAKLEGEQKKPRERLKVIENAQRERQRGLLAGDVPNQIVTAEGEQIQIASEIKSLVAQQEELSLRAKREKAQAKRIRTYIELQQEFSNLEVSVCPSCTQRVEEAEIDRETKAHECRLCSKATHIATPEDTAKFELEASERDAEVERIQTAHSEVTKRIATRRKDEEELNKRITTLRSTISAGVSASYPTAEEEAEKAQLNEQLGKLGHQIWAINQKLNEAAGGGEDAEKQAKVVAKVREVLQKEAETRNGIINERLKEMTQAVTTAIGAKNINGISCSALGAITLLKNEEKVTFGGFKNPGERFRVKLAFFLAMMQLGREGGLGRHPGFLLIDQLGAAEMVHDNMNASAAALKKIDLEFADQIQIICSTTRPEFAAASTPEKVYGAKVKTATDTFAF